MPYTDEYIERRKAMLADAERKGSSDDDSKMHPSVASESKEVMQTVGDLAGIGAIVSGITALAVPPTAPVTVPLAMGLGTTSAGMQVGEGLTDIRQGQKSGAGKVALGMIEGAMANPLSPQKQRILFSKNRLGRLTEKVKPYGRGFLEDIGINVAQEKYRSVADEE